jgi:hypothetical protein
MSLDRPLFSADPDAADRRTRPCTYTACDRAAPCQRYRRCSRARALAARGTTGSHSVYRLGRLRSGPGPGRRRPQPPLHLVRHRDRQPGPCHRPRLRPARIRQRPGQHAKPDKPDGPDPPGRPRFTFTPAGQPGPPGGGEGSWRFSTGIPGQRDLLLDIEPVPTEGCDHRHQAKGHDPGVKLRHLSQVRHATCTGPGCQRPATHCDFEHNIPYEAGGRTCLCNGNPKCRFDPPRQARSPLESRTTRKLIRTVDHAVGAAVYDRTTRYPV